MRRVLRFPLNPLGAMAKPRIRFHGARNLNCNKARHFRDEVPFWILHGTRGEGYLVNGSIVIDA